MPDLSISRQEMAKQLLVKQQQAPGISCIGGVEFHHDTQKMTSANSLFQSVIKGNINKVRHLLARGINTNLKNDYGFSPLIAALHIEDSQKRARMFRMLLDKGASTTVRDTNKTKRSVLQWACVLGQSQQVSCLLEETAGDIDLNEKDGDGLTAMHHAVKIGSLHIVDLLVDYHVRFGVTVDVADNMGLTPYMHARRLGYRDVATVLRNKGLASLGHGDNLFRSPREWSQIGKFERKKAIVLENQDKINAFKIMGRVNMVPLLENGSPRLAIPDICIPSYRPPEMNPPFSNRKPPHHLSASLPSLTQAPGLANDTRPMSASRQDKMENKTTVSVDKPGPPTVAFVNTMGNAQPISSTQAVDSASSFKSVAASNPVQNSRLTNPSVRKINSQATSSYVSISTGTNQLPFSENTVLRGGTDTNVAGRQGVRDGIPRAIRSDSNTAVLDLLQQTTKGRVVSQFHHSEFDKSKESEYKQMLGNLNSIMDVLSQQQTKSFRKSVEVKKPETPPKVKKKSKVSTLAIIFGSDGRRLNNRKKKSRSPSSDGKSSKSKNSRSKSGKKKGEGLTDKVTKQSTSTANRLPVPTIKIN